MCSTSEEEKVLSVELALCCHPYTQNNDKKCDEHPPPPHTHYTITLFVCHTKQYIWQFLTFTGRLNTSSSLTQKKSLSSLATPKWCRRASRLPSPCSSLTSPKNQGPCWMQLYYRRLLHRGRTTLSSTWEQRYWAFHSSTLPQAPHTQRI